MFQRLPITSREWGLFGLRWAIPVALIAYALLAPTAPQGSRLVPILAAAGLAIVTNVLVGALLVNGYWAAFLPLSFIVLDALLSALAVYLIDLRMAWAGLVPAVLAGVYGNWWRGLAGGAAVGVLILIAWLLDPGTMGPNLNGLLGLAALPLAGTVAAPLSQAAPAAGPSGNGSAQPVPAGSKERGAAARRASDYMSILYGMAEVLSASKLAPARVLNAAVTFTLEGLERVGVKPPLHAVVLLVAEDTAGGSEMRVAEASGGVPSSDRARTVPGARGAIAATLQQLEPVLLDQPAADPEIGLYDTFRTCHTVLCLPLHAGTDVYGVQIVGSQQPHAFDRMHVELMRAVANQVAASLNNASLYITLLEQRDRVVEVEKNARAQLASDLHDGPTQNLSAITMRLNYVRRLLDRNPELALGELYEIEELARRTTKEVRALLFELRPKSLEKGLGPGLEQLAARAEDTYNQNVEVQVVGQADSLLDSHAKLTLFSIVVEALNNARKHAEASRVHVLVAAQQDALVMTVQDDGKGFDVEKALREAKDREGHLGLVNLQERAALIDGTLHITSEPGKGTRLTVAVPLTVLQQRRAEETRGAAEA